MIEKRKVKNLISSRLRELSYLTNLKTRGNQINPVFVDLDKPLRKSDTCPFKRDTIINVQKSSISRGKRTAGFVQHDRPTRPLFYLETLKYCSRDRILNTADHEFNHVLYLLNDDGRMTDEELEKMEDIANKFMVSYKES